MEVNEFILKNGNLVTQDDRAFNAEGEAALVKINPANFELKFKAGCVPIYEKTQEYKLLTAKFDNDLIDYINGLSGTITAINEDFEQVMNDEGLQDLLGNARVIRINFTTKTLTNGMDCNPCDC